MFADRDLGAVLPDSVWLIRKLILSNGLFGSVARMATWLWCCDEWQLRLWKVPLFRKTASTSSSFSVVILLSFIAFFPPLHIIVPLHRIVFSLIFIWCYFLSFSPCLSIFFLFLSASPPRCQRFTLDIQLLAGHSIVISFRQAPFSAGPQTAIQITSSAAFRVAALQNVVFKQFWGHHLIWSHKYNWMSVVT